MPKRDESDSLWRVAQEVLAGAQAELGLTADALRRLLEVSPLSRSPGECRSHQAVASVADRVMKRRQYTVSIVDGFYSSAREGKRGEDTFVTGIDALLMHGYPRDVIFTLPSDAITRFLGLGNVWSGIGLPHGNRVIDIGCGSGVDLGVASALSGHSAFIVGIDKRPDLLEVAAEACPSASLIVADTSELPLTESSFDVVLANGLPPLQRPATLGSTAESLYALAASGGAIGATVIVASPVLTSTLAAAFEEESANGFMRGLATLISGKPTTEDVMEAFSCLGAKVTLQQGTNPYRDKPSRQQTAMFNVTAHKP